MTLKNALENWMDFDGAQYELAKTLGIMTEADDFCTTVKHVFWTNNSLGNSLSDILESLVDAGVLLQNDDQEFKWNSDYRGSWQGGTNDEG